jgi:hypothetical protein
MVLTRSLTAPSYHCSCPCCVRLVRDGGLMSYGGDPRNCLNGLLIGLRAFSVSRPGDLPFEQPKRTPLSSTSKLPRA